MCLMKYKLCYILVRTPMRRHGVPGAHGQEVGAPQSGSSAVHAMQSQQGDKQAVAT